MSLIDEIASHLLREEGLRLKPYIDTVGKTTIGVGRNLTDRGITEAEAIVLLNNDITETLQECAKFSFWDKINDARRLVIADMAFNLGFETLSTFHLMISAIEAQDWSQASSQMLQSKWAGQVGSRATRLSQIMLTGI